MEGVGCRTRASCIAKFHRKEPVYSFNNYSLTLTVAAAVVLWSFLLTIHTLSQCR